MKFKKLYKDTITFPKNIPASGISDIIDSSIHSDYYILLEKNYKPVKSTENISDDYDWLDVSLIIDDDEYNKLIVIRAGENKSTTNIRKACIEFTLDKEYIDNTYKDPCTNKMIKECNSLYAWFILDMKEVITTKLNVYELGETDTPYYDKTISDETYSNSGNTILYISGKEQYIKIKYSVYINNNDITTFNQLSALENYSTDFSYITTKQIKEGDETKLETILKINEYTYTTKTKKRDFKLQLKYKNKSNTITIRQYPLTYDVSILGALTQSIPFTGNDDFPIQYYCIEHTYVFMNNDNSTNIDTSITDNLKLNLIQNNNVPLIDYEIKSSSINDDTSVKTTILNIKANNTLIEKKLKAYASYNNINSKNKTITQNKIDGSSVMIYYKCRKENGEDITISGDTSTLNGQEQTIIIKYYAKLNGSDNIISLENTNNIIEYLTCTISPLDNYITVISDNIGNDSLGQYKEMKVLFETRSDDVTYNFKFKFPHISSYKTLTIKLISTTIKFEELKISSPNSNYGGFNDDRNLVEITFNLKVNSQYITDPYLYNISIENNNTDTVFSELYIKTIEYVNNKLKITALFVNLYGDLKVSGKYPYQETNLGEKTYTYKIKCNSTVSNTTITLNRYPLYYTVSIDANNTTVGYLPQNRTIEYYATVKNYKSDPAVGHEDRIVLTSDDPDKGILLTLTPTNIASLSNNPVIYSDKITETVRFTQNNGEQNRNLTITAQYKFAPKTISFTLNYAATTSNVYFYLYSNDFGSAGSDLILGNITETYVNPFKDTIIKTLAYLLDMSGSKITFDSTKARYEKSTNASNIGNDSGYDRNKTHIVTWTYTPPSTITESAESYNLTLKYDGADANNILTIKKPKIIQEFFVSFDSTRLVINKTMPYEGGDVTIYFVCKYTNTYNSDILYIDNKNSYTTNPSSEKTWDSDINMCKGTLSVSSTDILKTINITVTYSTLPSKKLTITQTAASYDAVAYFANNRNSYNITYTEKKFTIYLELYKGNTKITDPEPEDITTDIKKDNVNAKDDFISGAPTITKDIANSRYKCDFTLNNENNGNTDNIYKIQFTWALDTNNIINTSILTLTLGMISNINVVLNVQPTSFSNAGGKSTITYYFEFDGIKQNIKDSDYALVYTIGNNTDGTNIPKDDDPDSNIYKTQLIIRPNTETSKIYNIKLTFKGKTYTKQIYQGSAKINLVFGCVGYRTNNIIISANTKNITLYYYGEINGVKQISETSKGDYTLTNNNADIVTTGVQQLDDENITQEITFKNNDTQSQRSVKFTLEYMGLTKTVTVTQKVFTYEACLAIFKCNFYYYDTYYVKKPSFYDGIFSVPFPEPTPLLNYGDPGPLELNAREYGLQFRFYGQDVNRHVEYNLDTAPIPRVKLYVNGEDITAWGAGNTVYLKEHPTQDELAWCVDYKYIIYVLPLNEDIYNTKTYNIKVVYDYMAGKSVEVEKVILHLPSNYECDIMYESQRISPTGKYSIEYNVSYVNIKFRGVHILKLGSTSSDDVDYITTYNMNLDKPQTCKILVIIDNTPIDVSPENISIDGDYIIYTHRMGMNQGDTIRNFKYKAFYKTPYLDSSNSYKIVESPTIEINQNFYALNLHLECDQKIIPLLQKENAFTIYLWIDDGVNIDAQKTRNIEFKHEHDYTEWPEEYLAAYPEYDRDGSMSSFIKDESSDQTVTDETGKRYAIYSVKRNNKDRMRAQLFEASYVDTESNPGSPITIKKYLLLFQASENDEIFTVKNFKYFIAQYRPKLGHTLPLSDSRRPYTQDYPYNYIAYPLSDYYFNLFKPDSEIYGIVGGSNTYNLNNESGRDFVDLITIKLKDDLNKDVSLNINVPAYKRTGKNDNTKQYTFTPAGTNYIQNINKIEIGNIDHTDIIKEYYKAGLGFINTTDINLEYTLKDYFLYGGRTVDPGDGYTSFAINMEKIINDINNTNTIKSQVSSIDINFYLGYEYITETSDFNNTKYFRSNGSFDVSINTYGKINESDGTSFINDNVFKNALDSNTRHHIAYDNHLLTKDDGNDQDIIGKDHKHKERITFDTSVFNYGYFSPLNTTDYLTKACVMHYDLKTGQAYVETQKKEIGEYYCSDVYIFYFDEADGDDYKIRQMIFYKYPNYINQEIVGVLNGYHPDILLTVYKKSPREEITEDFSKTVYSYIDKQHKTINPYQKIELSTININPGGSLQKMNVSTATKIPYTYNSNTGELTFNCPTSTDDYGTYELLGDITLTVLDGTEDGTDYTIKHLIRFVAP